MTIPASQERLLDAQEIDVLLAKDGIIQRSSVRAHLESLAQKIRRDANALKRMEASQDKLNNNIDNVSAGEDDTDKPHDLVEAATAGATTTSAEAVAVGPVSSAPAVAAPAPAKPSPVSAAAPPTISTSLRYKPIDKFSFDAGSYNSPSVTIYVLLSNIGTHPKSQVNCSFTKSSFDLTISDFNGVNYRLLKDNLEHEIDAEGSKVKIKANKIILKLQKVKSEYGSYDSWNELTSKKGKDGGAGKKKDDPTSSIMGLMKDMYDKGDDKMKKMIGETMTKQREGKLNSGGLDQGMDDMKF